MWRPVASTLKMEAVGCYTSAYLPSYTASHQGLSKSFRFQFGSIPLKIWHLRIVINKQTYVYFGYVRKLSFSFAVWWAFWHIPTRWQMATFLYCSAAISEHCRTDISGRVEEKRFLNLFFRPFSVHWSLLARDYVKNKVQSSKVTSLQVIERIIILDATPERAHSSTNGDHKKICTQNQ